MKLKKGMQIAYIPNHADGDVDHPDVEFGFVTSVKGDTVFCRYWRSKDSPELRTKTNSEGASKRYISYYVSRPQNEVDEVIKDYEI